MIEKRRRMGGAPLNFRGLVCSPINEQGVVYLFGLIANDLNLRVESIQQGYPDCTAIRYVGKGKWERIKIEFEYTSSSFDHNPEKCDWLVCWKDDLKEDKKGALTKFLEIYELKSMINTPEIPDIPLKDPEESAKEKIGYHLEYHFERSKVTLKIKELYMKLEQEIQAIDESIWIKFAQTAITFYSPEKVFVFLRLRKSSLSLTIFTDQEKIDGVQNIKDHENWGRRSINNMDQLPQMISAIKISFELIKRAVKINKNTGWYALTPRQTQKTEE